MRAFLSILLGAGALVCVAASAFSGSTATIGVSATVVGSCTFGTSGNLTFGNLQQGSGQPASVSNPVAATFNCTTGTNYSISDNGGLRGTYVLRNAGGVSVPYSLSYTNTGVGTGAATNLAVAATIQATDYDSVPPGDYSDTLILTFNY